ncbi:ribose-phosphate diphosphokinase [Halalkalibacter urbisdiaboli]|uniref:ribose-phosphate diphosphokinase n=1 Tax=Halalkalibacter urbisdiaboli TaxID=1960589 RepID=UPI000B42E6DF|nr:ribose-phosphate pyrophosphokinase [Halalkalibacter urbisdiaboli]
MDKMKNKMKVFALNSNVELANEIVTHLGIEMGKSVITRFSDGEVQMNVEESVRGCDVYLIQSTSQPGNDYIMELLIMIDAMKRASANSITVVMPYYGYSRQDRKARSREPVTAKLIANLLETAGATGLITVDLHATQVEGFFDIPVDQIHTVAFLSEFYKEKNLEDIVVVAPENAGVKRARQLSSLLKVPIVFMDKQRGPTADDVKIDIIGDVTGLNAVIIDDMVATGKTVTTASETLIKKGAKSVYACCTHPVLSGPAIQRIQQSPIKELVVTNTIELSNEKNIEKITTLSIAPLIADVIKRVQNNQSVSTLFT